MISCNADESPEIRNLSARASKRRRIDSEENSTAKTDEQVLKTFVIKKRFVRAREEIQTTMAKFRPQVKLVRLSPREIFRQSNDWRFLANFKLNDAIDFKCEVLAVHAQKQKVLVRWFPTGIIEDNWLDRRSLSQDGVVKVNVQNLSWQQKLKVRNKLINHSWDTNDTLSEL